MAKAGKKYLTRTLKSYTDGIQETIQLFQEAPASTLDKVPWEQVVAMADQVSKQATIAGLLWKEATTELQALEENMSAYFKMLQGLLLLSHGTKVGAGPTLSSCIHASAKKVVECSLTFLREAVLSYGSRSLTHIPPLAGTVWEACESLKKTPTTNYTAIGRGITQAAVSVKDVVRELKDLKPGNNDPVDDALDRDAAAETSHESHSNHSSSEDDLGDDLSPEEMIIAQSAVSFVSDILVIIKELIQVDNLGACLYPPQELTSIKVASDNISSAVTGMKAEALTLEVSLERFSHACEDFGKSLRKLQSELGSPDATELVPGLQNLTVSM
ncbi:hypothetical protein IFM89_027542 [Coptis chinensis]|uniref:Cyclin-D1-binding protein 1-like N-terminal domain-containing protein n=1 Tax=Coptis chinensis TaxID=261450 RepID=A0A835HSI4_9MAGN|nr:hypothetical protein IFM89_027542 [Coptis chinensis]